MERSGRRDLANSFGRKVGKRWTLTAMALALPMRLTPIAHDQVLESLTVLLRDLMARLPERCVTMELIPEGDHRAAILKLLPANPNAASIRIIVPPNAKEKGITIVAGTGSFFEIPIEGGRYTSFSFPEEVRSICLAVIAGKLEESVTLQGDKVLRSRGTITLDGKSITVRWRQLTLRPFRRKEEKRLKYEPYCGVS